VDLPIVIAFGGGVDSVEATLELLQDRVALRCLREGAVMMAQTGHEWPDTKAAIEQEVFPRLAAARIRTVQVARRGPLKEHGVAILDDTDRPTTCYTRPTKQMPYYTLGQELLLGGTIPQLTGPKICSQKSKGVPLDEVRELHVTRGRRYLHLMGFEVRETSRIAKDQQHNTELRCGWYPLAEQGKDRASCVAGIHEKTGRTWDKSACTFCVFAINSRAGQQHILDRFERFPAEGAVPLAIEEVAIRLNPAQGLAGMNRRTRQGIRLLDLMAGRAGLAGVVAEHEQRLNRTRWAIYQVQRAVLGATNIARRICAVRVGPRIEMESALAQFGDVEVRGRIERAWRHRRSAELPSVEEFYVAAPYTVQEKLRPGFWRMWAKATQHISGHRHSA
jgi:hypothetical protein